MKAVRREKFLSREQAEKQVRKHVDALRKIRGFHAVAMRVKIRTSDNVPNSAVEFQFAHSL